MQRRSKIKRNRHLLFWVDLRGGIWLGLFSLVMLVGVIQTLFFKGADIPGGVIGVYGTVVATFGITKLGAKAINGKNGQHVEEE